MKVTALRTVRSETFPNMLWVLVETDDGLVGLGETFRQPAAVEAHIAETVAPYLIGKDPRAVEAHWQALGSSTAARAMGAEARALSAIDIALWDIIGRETGKPVYRLLGGPVRDAIRTYNTCAGYGYNTYKSSVAVRAATSVWEERPQDGPYDDLEKWRTKGQAGELAKSLLESGITAMKIWPFDDYARPSNGQFISRRDLDIALVPFRQIRDAVGLNMEITVELHSMWNLPSAVKIAEALEEIQPMWYEDPIRMDNLATLAEFARSTRVPTTASETLTTRFNFREALERDAVGIVMLDPGWVGGISESRRIAALAETYHRPIAPHDCTGPVVYIAGAHLCLATPNAMIQESVRAYYTGWYTDVVTALPTIEDGMLSPPEGPGLGTSLRPEFLRRADVTVRVHRS